MNAKSIVIVVVIVLVVGIAAGAGGYSMGTKAGIAQAQAIRSNFFAARGGTGAQGGTGAPSGGQNGGRAFNADNFAAGQVKQIDANTVQLSTATDVVKVILSDKTQIQKMATGTAADITTGERITVQGTRNADGTFAAQSVQIGGAFRGPGGQGGQGQGGTGGAGGQRPTPAQQGSTN